MYVQDLRDSLTVLGHTKLVQILGQGDTDDDPSLGATSISTRAARLRARSSAASAAERTTATSRSGELGEIVTQSA